MKKFIKRAVIFSIPVVITIICIELLLRKIPNDYRYKNEYLENHSNEIEILFLGSSHVYYGVNPKYITYNSFNAANKSQSLDYDVKILQKFEKKLKNIKKEK